MRLVGAELMEQNDEWTEARRYMGLAILAKIGSEPANTRNETPALEGLSA